MSYGPQLPAWLSKSQNQEENTKDNKEKNEDDAPTSHGPIFPGTAKKAKGNTEKNEEPTCYGPIFPGMAMKAEGKTEKDACYGPIFPKKADSEEQEEDDDDEEGTSNSYGPAIPANFRPHAGPSLPTTNYDDSDDDIGPMPVSAGDEEKEELERAYRIVLLKMTEEELKNSHSKREEWMTSVPQKLTSFGLGARTFKKGTASERDSTWEDAPGSKKKRKEETRTSKSVGMAAADARQAAIVEQKTMGPSLLELHQKQREEKAKDAGLVLGERRPFDREKDMEIRGLKPGGSKEAVDRMKEFQDRFANSKEQRFL